MPKYPGPGDFIYEAPAADPAAVTSGASRGATKLVYGAIAIAFVLLFLVVVGLHIPAE